MTTEKTTNALSKIVEWQKERQLLRGAENVDLKNEVSFIVEELIEMISPHKSETARERAKEVVHKWKEEGLFSEKNDPENIVDAACDIIVFATGLIAKMGYEPNIAMDETLKEISSRTGEIIDGKFVKCKTEECKKKWYKADYSKAKKEGYW